MANQDARLRVILESQTQGLQTGLKATSADVDKFKEKLKGLGQQAAETRDSLGRPIKIKAEVEVDKSSLETLTGDIGGLGESIEDQFRIGNLFDPKSIEKANKLGEAVTGVSQKLVDFAAKTVRGIGVLEEMGAKIGENQFIKAAGQVERYTAQLKALLGSAEAARAEIQRLSDYAGQTPFDLPGLVEASIQLRSFQVDAQRFLPVAASLAAVAGRTVPDAATALGKALAGIPEGLTALQESFRLTKADLISAGAALDNTGAISLKTVKQIEQLGDAIEKATKKKFGNIIGEQSQTLEGALSNLEDSFFRLKAALGESFLPLAVAAANGLAKLADFATGVAKAFNSIPSEIKQVLGVFAGLIALIARFGPAVQAVVAAIGSISLPGVIAGLEAAGTAAAGFLATLGPLGLALAVVAGVAISFASTLSDINYRNDEAEKFVQIQERMAHGLAENKDLLGKTAAEIAAMGKGAYETTEALQGLIQQLEELRHLREEAEKRGASKEELDAIDGRIQKTLKLEKATRAARNELAQQEIQAGKTKEAIVKSADDAAEAYIRFEQKRKERIFANKKEELAAQDEIQKKVETSIKDLEKKKKQAEDTNQDKVAIDALEKRLNEQKAILTKIKDDRIDLERDSLTESLNLQTQALNHEVNLGKKSKAEQAARLRELAGEFSKLQAEKVQLIQQAEELELQAQNEIKQAVIDRADAERAGLENKVRLAERNLQLTSDIGQAEQDLASAVSAKYDKEIELLEEKSKLEQSMIAEPKLRAEAEKKTQAEISSLRDQEKQDLLGVAESARQARSKQIEQNIKLINSERELAEIRSSGLERKFGRGDNVAQALAEEKRKISELNEQELREQEKIALKNAKTAEERLAINVDTDVKIASNRIKLVQDIEDLEIESAKKIASQKVAKLEVEKDSLEIRKNALQDEIALGNVTFGVAERKKALILEELELNKKLIKAKGDEAAAGASANDKARIQKDTQNQITTAIRNSKQAIKDLNDEYKIGNTELDKQLKKLEKIRNKNSQIDDELEGIQDKKEDGGGFGSIRSQEEADREEELKNQKREGARKEKEQAERVRKEQEKANRAAEARAQAEIEKGNRAKKAADDLRSRGKSEDEIEKIINTNFGKGAYDGTKAEAKQDTTIKAKPKSGTIPVDGEADFRVAEEPKAKEKVKGGNAVEVAREAAAGATGGPGAQTPEANYLAQILSAVQMLLNKAGIATSSGNNGKPNAKPQSSFDWNETSSGGYPGLS